MSPLQHRGKGAGRLHIIFHWFYVDTWQGIPGPDSGDAKVNPSPSWQMQLPKKAQFCVPLCPLHKATCQIFDSFPQSGTSHKLVLEMQ
jgi:hypothetical protein